MVQYDFVIVKWARFKDKVDYSAWFVNVCCEEINFLSIRIYSNEMELVIRLEIPANILLYVDVSYISGHRLAFHGQGINLSLDAFVGFVW